MFEFFKKLNAMLPWNKRVFSAREVAEMRARMYGGGVPCKVGKDGKIHVTIERDGDSLKRPEEDTDPDEENANQRD